MISYKKVVVWKVAVVAYLKTLSWCSSR